MGWESAWRDEVDGGPRVVHEGGDRKRGGKAGWQTHAIVIMARIGLPGTRVPTMRATGRRQGNGSLSG